MSLTQALSSAISGLQANQASLALVSSNVANANTPGYIRKTISQTAMAGSAGGISVNVVGIQREFDQYVQRQLRVESSGAAFADLRAQFYNQIQSLFGTPGASSSLESIYNNFTTALQALSTSPDDSAARSAVIGAAQQLADPAQPDERQRAEPARHRRTGLVGLGRHRQRGDAADRRSEQEDRGVLEFRRRRPRP